jgi:hypothetical protein
MPKYFVILFLLTLTEVQAQSQKLFHDTLGLSGMVKYSGIWYDSLLPKQGNYELSWRTSSEGMLSTYFSKGRLKSHMPEGRWTWEQADWDFAVKPGSSIIPEFMASGERKIWTANFLNGQAHGNWVFTLDSLIQGKTTGKELVQIQGKFDQGRISENFTIKDNRPETSFMLTGQTDKDGVATGKWIFKFKENPNSEIVTEERIYEKGILTEIKLIKRDTVQYIIAFDDVKRILSELQQTKEPLPYRIGPDDFETDGYESKGKDLMKAFLFHFFNEGWQLPQFPYHFERKGPVFRKIQYPLSEDQLSFIEKSDSLLKGLIPEIKQRLNYRNILINRGRNRELDLALAYAQSGLKKLHSLDSLLETTRNPHFSYTNTHRSFDLNDDPLFSYKDPIKGELGDTQVLYLPQLNFEYDRTHFENIYHLVKAFQIQFSRQLYLIDSNYQELQKESTLLLIEDRITEKLQMLDSLYADISGVGVLVRDKWVRSYLRDQLKVLSQSTEIENAQLLASSIEHKIDKLITLTSDWPVIDSFAFRIKEQYTHYAYNPYTGFHDIEIRIKKRFYNKMAQVLLPWLKTEFEQIDDWEEWIEHVRIYKETYHQLMAFALLDDKETKRTEKRIRREKSPARMQRILSGYMRD